jgi:hypothetical protein
MEVAENEREKNQSFIARLKSSYRLLERSRLANHRETDQDALGYFQRICNESLPKNEAEQEFKDGIRELYYANKTSFTQCLVRAPHYVLLTEARAIVLHFGVQDLVYIEWKNNEYVVSENKRETDDKGRVENRSDKRNRGVRGNVRRETIQELRARLERLERVAEGSNTQPVERTSVRGGEKQDRKPRARVSLPHFRGPKKNDKRVNDQVDTPSHVKEEKKVSPALPEENQGVKKEVKEPTSENPYQPLARLPPGTAWADVVDDEEQ